tara:strand:- start:59 stop:424 length:366 start_codon:yes stop_codon:yes gene_type:complete
MQASDRYEEMRAQCAAFHKQHPEVWDLFVKFSFQMIERGFQHYSIAAIWERIRYEKDAGGDGVLMFKLNNNHKAFYVRRFHAMYPQHDGFFRTREQTTKGKEPTGLPELTPQFFEGRHYGT